MKKNFKYYLAGLLTGILVGIGIFFIFQSGQEKKTHQFIQEESITEEPAKIKEKKSLKNKPEAKTSNKTIKEKPPEQTPNPDKKASREKTDTLQAPDTTNQAITEDTIPHSSDSLSQNDNIIVIEDKLLNKQTVAIKYVNADTNETPKNLDSLLIDDQTTRNKQLDSITIEYWKSPINYKGYRRIYNRLIVFGFTPKDSIEIFHHKNQLFMELRDKNFPLDETNNFRSIWFNK
ncbi:MAG: hypothetical protein ACOCPM_04125 [Bacteroidales bacterium]